MTAGDVRRGLVWLLRLGFYVLFFALLLRQCQGTDGTSALAADGAAADPVARQVECFEHAPPLFYDQDGNCFSQDPTGLSAEQRAAVAVVPASRVAGLTGATGPVAPGPAAPAGPLPPGLVDPRSPDANPPPVLALPPVATGGGTTGTTGTTGTAATPPAAAPADTTQPAGAPPASGGSAATPATATPTSPSLGYIAEDGRTDAVTEGPVINEIQVWVHEPSRTLYADSCEVLTTITALGQEFGPTEQAPGYASICPQL